MNPINPPENRVIFLVPPSRLAWGEYVGDRKIGEGDMRGSYSADRISENKPIRQPFTWQGNLWSCVSISGRGPDGDARAELTAYRLTAFALFHGEATTYASKRACDDSTETMPNDPLGSYHGIIVKHGKSSFVLSGPPGIFMAKEDSKEATSAVQLGLF